MHVVHVRTDHFKDDSTAFLARPRQNQWILALLKNDVIVVVFLPGPIDPFLHFLPRPGAHPNPKGICCPVVLKAADKGKHTGHGLVIFIQRDDRLNVASA